MSVTFIRASLRGGLAPMRKCRRFHHPDFNAREMQGWKWLRHWGSPRHGRWLS